MGIVLKNGSHCGQPCYALRPGLIVSFLVLGLDFKSIFPVIQWLVKKVVETRAEMGDHIRAFSISQFEKFHKASLDSAEEMTEKKRIDTLLELTKSYRYGP